jgi:hypothetical protein
MKESPETISIDNVEYVRRDSFLTLKGNTENYSVIRTEHAGIHVGYVIKTDLSTASVVLQNARRIWYWDGACSASQLAVDGVTKAGEPNCKFSVTVPEITILGVIEIIPCTLAAMKNIQQVRIWKK